MPDKQRVQCYIDGFNLYHAIDNLKRPQLKWFNLKGLMSVFIDQNIHSLKEIYYFSAYADWMPESSRRHRELVAALENNGVTPILGQFKAKDKSCKKCGAQWVGHEEKETDVNIAIHLLKNALLDNFDIAYLVTRDSDMTPAVKMIKDLCPQKKIKVIAPPNLRHSKELAKVVGNDNLASIKIVHLERNILPSEIFDENGNVIVTIPEKYK